MSEEKIREILGQEFQNLSIDEDLFAGGHLDSLSILQLLEWLSPVTGISTLDLSGDLARIATIRKILHLFNTGRGGSP